MKVLIRVVIVVVVAVVLASLLGAFYVVDETKQVIITKFGKPVGDPIVTPGLKLKIPILHTANYFEKRFLEWDGDPNEVPTRDKRFIYVDTYARWRITDPLKFFERLRDELGALSRLSDILDGETRNVIASHDLLEVVRSSNRDFAASEEIGATDEEVDSDIQHGRTKLAREVLTSAQSRTADLGIEILDFRFKRINYVVEVRQKVYQRMVAERQRIAKQFRSEGEGEAARIAGDKDRELKRITSEAYRTSQEIMGKADAEAANIYAAAYNTDPEFYRFVKSLEVLEQTMDAETTLVLSTTGELTRYLDRSK
jgi:membrane protease subunit HflC